LIGSIGRVKFGSGDQSRNDGRNKMMISPSAEETATGYGLKPLKMAEEVELREGLREV
jgi:hypothetical protein